MLPSPEPLRAGRSFSTRILNLFPPTTLIRKGRKVQKAMGIDARKEAKRIAENYKKALKYLDKCKNFTYDDLVKTNQIAGSPMSEPDLQRMWEQSQYILPIGGEPGGAESLRKMMRNTLIESISAFETIVQELGKK
jgi:hypothetical protein